MLKRSRWIATERQRSVRIVVERIVTVRGEVLMLLVVGADRWWCVISDRIGQDGPNRLASGCDAVSLRCRTAPANARSMLMVVVVDGQYRASVTAVTAVTAMLDTSDTEPFNM